MNTLLEYGITWIVWLQGLGDWLEIPMEVFTFMGSEEFFLMIAPAILWCANLAAGLRVGLYLMISGNLNYLFKVAFAGPRPFWFDPQVRALSVESSFGLPSGHAQNSVVVWGGLAAWVGTRAAWIAAISLAFMIGLSRMYLGVHFPTDVVMGWILGALLLWVLLKVEGPVKQWVGSHKPSESIAAAFGASLLMIVLSYIFWLVAGEWAMPAAWSANILSATQTPVDFDPQSLSGVFSNSGAFFGLAAGAVLLSLSGGFNASGSWDKRAARYVIGLVGVLIIWRGLGSILPGGENLVAFVFRYLRYTLIGLWIVYLAPLVFIRLGLAQGDQPAATKAAQPS